MSSIAWLWIPVTLWAAFAQTLRNVMQRRLSAELGVLGATLVRFLYGLPFAVLWFIAVWKIGGFVLPGPTLTFVAWVILGSVSQIAATALLLRVMAERNFTLGVAYSKSELIQVAVFSQLFLGDRLSFASCIAIALGTLGVALISPVDRARPLRSLITGLGTRSALLGLASGTGFALSALGFRGASLALDGTPFLMAAATTLLVAQSLQTLLLGGWLVQRDRTLAVKVLTAWRPSLFAGFMGAAASAGWFTAMALEPVARVRTLGLIELLFSYVISRRLFQEKLASIELAGLGLLTLGLIIVTLGL